MNNVTNEESVAPEFMKNEGTVLQRVAELKKSSKDATVFAGVAIGVAAGTLLFFGDVTLAANNADLASKLANFNQFWVRNMIALTSLAAGVAEGIEAIGDRNEANVLQAALIKRMKEQI